MNSQALPGDDVEKRGDIRNGLDLTITGGGRQQRIEGYVSRAPEGASASWEVTYTPELLALPLVLVSEPDPIDGKLVINMLKLIIS